MQIYLAIGTPQIEFHATLLLCLLWMYTVILQILWSIHIPINFYIKHSALYTCRSFAAVGVDPAVMGVGPAVAIPAAVKSAGLEISDIDLYEINEVLVHLVLP